MEEALFVFQEERPKDGVADGRSVEEDNVGGRPSYGANLLIRI